MAEVTLDQRTPNIRLKFESDDTRNYNWSRLDDEWKRVFDMLAIFASDVPRAAVEKTVLQTVPPSTPTHLAFDRILGMSGGLFDLASPDHFTIVDAGFYLIGGFIEWSGGQGTSGNQRSLGIYIPPDPWRGTSSVPPSTNPVSNIAVVAMPLEGGQTVYLEAWHDAATALNLTATRQGFWLVRVG